METEPKPVPLSDVLRSLRDSGKIAGVTFHDGLAYAVDKDSQVLFCCSQERWDMLVIESRREERVT
jgi:hypothetical protein